MIPRISSHHTAGQAVWSAMSEWISPDTQLHEGHVISWGDLPLPPHNQPWTLRDLTRRLDEPIALHEELSAGRLMSCVWQCTLSLHPQDGGLNDDNWTRAAHRILYAAGIADDIEDAKCRWALLRDGGRAAHIIATLIREPDHRRRILPPVDAARAVAAECERLTEEFALTHVPLDAPAHREQTATTAQAQAYDPAADEQRHEFLGHVVFGVDEHIGITATFACEPQLGGLIREVLGNVGFFMDPDADTYRLRPGLTHAQALKRTLHASRILHAAQCSVTTTDGLQCGAHPAAGGRPPAAALTALADKAREARDPQQLADAIDAITNNDGVLTQLERFVEAAGIQAKDRLPDHGTEHGHRLAWAARRLHALHRDLADVGTELRATPTRPRATHPAAAAPPAPLRYTPQGRTR
ncbi:hypothetical protein ACWGCC_03745 [Streptomyces nigrescens]